MNNYDDVALDVTQLLHRQAQAGAAWRASAHSGERLPLLSQIAIPLARWLTAGAYASGLWRRLMYANLKLAWFDEFRQYWVKELGLRRIEPHDFYYLSGVYRQKFQAIEVTNEKDSLAFLKPWQDPATLYLLFHYQYKLALHPLAAYTLARYIPAGASVCEYGCGLAPITQCLAKFYPTKNLRLTAADIPSYLLHFVSWKFQHTPFVRVVSLDPGSDAPLDQPFDIIVCMTVFEHLPRPLATIKHLHERLKPGGIFMFDYIKSEGSGLDTTAALEQRQAVLTFIREHFTVLRGSIPTDGRNVKAVICRKKRPQGTKLEV